MARDDPLVRLTMEELYERSVKAFEELVKEYEKDTVLTKNGTLCGVLRRLLCEVEFSLPLTGLPLSQHRPRCTWPL